MKKNQNLIPKKGKAGFLDEGGKWVIKPIFDKTDSFKEGLARVKEDEKWGFIDKTGKVVIDIKYDYAYDFEDGLAKIIFDDKVGFIDKSGKLIFVSQYDIYNFKEGRASIRVDRKFGFVDTKGKIVIEPIYEHANDFHEDLAGVKLDGKCGFIDKSGNIVIELKFDNIRFFREGLSPIEINGKWGFINKAGEIVIQPEFNQTRAFKECLAGVELDGKWGFIDKTGKIVIKPKYDDVSDFEDGICQVKDGKNWGYIDKTGEIIIYPSFRWIGSFGDRLFTHFRYSQEKYGVIDREGNVIIEPKFDRITVVNNEVVIAGDEERQGLLGMDGKWILQPKLEIGYQSEGLIDAKINDWGVVNEEGEWVVDPSYDYISEYYPFGRNGKILASARKDGKLTWLDENGKECPDAVVEYDKASREGRKSVPVEVYGEEWFIDAQDREGGPIEGKSAFVRSSLNIEIDGNYLDVEELNSIYREDELIAFRFCESVGAAKGILYYNKSAANPESFGEILIPEGEEFDPEKACLVKQYWETSENEADMVTSLIYDGVLYDLIPIDSVTKGSETIFGDDDDDEVYDFSWDD